MPCLVYVDRVLAGEAQDNKVVYSMRVGGSPGEMIVDHRKLSERRTNGHERGDDRGHRHELG
jgi:hypothetical protein